MTLASQFLKILREYTYDNSKWTIRVNLCKIIDLKMFSQITRRIKVYSLNV